MSHRTSNYPILQVILNRWSPRAMSGDTLSDQELMTIFEAGRWAQSSYNNQPWRFVYAKRETPEWSKFFNLLVPFNQSWCNNGAVLLIVASHKHFEFNEKDSRTAAFDTGAACQNMTLQAFSMGLVMHGMEGFDYQKAHEAINADEHMVIQAMFVIGHPADKKVLSGELQKRETPSIRKPLDEIVFKAQL